MDRGLGTGLNGWAEWAWPASPISHGPDHTGGATESSTHSAERVCVRFRSQVDTPPPTPPPPRLSNQRQGHPLNQLFPSPWNGRRPGHGMAQNLLAQVTRTVGTDSRPIVYSCHAGCCWLLLAIVGCMLVDFAWSVTSNPFCEQAKKQRS